MGRAGRRRGGRVGRAGRQMRREGRKGRETEGWGGQEGKTHCVRLSVLVRGHTGDPPPRRSPRAVPHPSPLSPFAPLVEDGGGRQTKQREEEEVDRSRFGARGRKGGRGG